MSVVVDFAALKDAPFRGDPGRRSLRRYTIDVSDHRVRFNALARIAGLVR